MKTRLTILSKGSRTFATTEPVSGRKPVLALLTRLRWTAVLVLPVLGAQAAVVFTTLYSFTGTNDGGNPQSVLVQGSDGYLYGTTFGYLLDGPNGTIFKISTNGALTTLYSFTGGRPRAALAQGERGSFYGTTFGFGGGTDTVFKISTNGALTTLYSFGSVQDTNGLSLDGLCPGGLVHGSDGNFYGTTLCNVWRGAFDKSPGGNGTIFKMSPTGALTTLYSFGSVQDTNGNALDGSQPYAALVQGSDGYLYGTTSTGGTNNYGTVFRISANGALTTLHSFGSVQDTNGNALDGANPYAGLVEGSDGYFYGTTYYGGLDGSSTVFKISATGALTSLYSFNGGNDGEYPVAALVQGRDGNFYGTTSVGSTNGVGTIFRLTVVPEPQLTIIPSEPYVILTWPTNASGFTLQSSTNLGSSAVWTTNSSPPVVIGGQNVVINAISGRQQFFRLSQ